MPPTIAEPPVSVLKLTDAGPATTPGNQTMPFTPVALVTHGSGGTPSKNGPRIGDGVDTAVTPDTPTPLFATVAMIEPVFTGCTTPLIESMSLNVSCRSVLITARA